MGVEEYLGGLCADHRAISSVASGEIMSAASTVYQARATREEHVASVMDHALGTSRDRAASILNFAERIQRPGPAARLPPPSRRRARAMTSALLAAVLIAGLAVTALAGPRVLRGAAPVLMRVPRVTVDLLSGGVAAWVLTLLAVGPVLASVIIESVRQRRSTLRTALRYRQVAEAQRLHGYDVLLVNDPHPFALSLPRRYGGIVISTGAAHLLSNEELTAVLAHENAHLQQHHHFITALVSGLITRLRWIPLLAAVEDALSHYLEIAADDHARRVSGTPALASALLSLAQAGAPNVNQLRRGALYALGPDRIGHLVQPSRGTAGAAAAMASACCMAALTFLTSIVYVPYMLAAPSGCV